jgi:hypothetical protein
MRFDLSYDTTDDAVDDVACLFKNSSGIHWYDPHLLFSISELDELNILINVNLVYY